MKRLSREEQLAERRAQWDNLPAGTTSARSSTRKSSLAAARIRKEKAVESDFRKYFMLECGHYGSKDAVFSSRNGEFYCDREGIFSPKLPPPGKREYPEEPEF